MVISTRRLILPFFGGVVSQGSSTPHSLIHQVFRRNSPLAPIGPRWTWPVPGRAPAGTPGFRCPQYDQRLKIYGQETSSGLLRCRPILSSSPGSKVGWSGYEEEVFDPQAESLLLPLRYLDIFQLFLFDGFCNGSGGLFACKAWDILKPSEDKASSAPYCGCRLIGIARQPWSGKKSVHYPNGGCRSQRNGYR
jgi:hypothetical protein